LFGALGLDCDIDFPAYRGGSAARETA